MPLPLDLLLLDSGDRFQRMCYRLVLKEYPDAIPVGAGSWDGGRDIVCFKREDGDVVWQCKFTRQNLSRIKPKILQSLSGLDQKQKIAKWILCVSVNVTGHFLDWLRTIIGNYKFIKSWEVWGKESLLMKLEQSPDVLELFFYPIWKTLESKFRTEELQLVRYTLSHDCGWKQKDQNTLEFLQSSGGSNNDLLLDVIVRSRGTIQSLVHSIRVELFDVRRQLRGLPGTGLLYSQVTYSVSLEDGTPGERVVILDPPLLVDTGEHQRFSIRCTDTGYAWTGYLRMAVHYADNKELVLPTIFLAA